MEVRRVTTSLLRYQSSPISILLSSCTTARSSPGRELSSRRSSNGLLRRTFGTTSPRNAARLTTTTTAPSPKSSNPEENSPNDLSSLSEGLGWANRPSRTSSAPSTRRPLSQEERLNGGSSAESILSSLAQAMSNSPYKRKSGIDTSLMQDPSAPLNSLEPRSEAMDVMKRVFKDIPPPKAQRIPIALKPLSGRMVDVSGSVDVGRGFRLLEQSCARNKVRSDATRQRFHERGGLKRKRLRRERWRKRFMEGFRATVGRVKQLRNQGW